MVGDLQNGIGTRALIDAGYRAECFVNCEPADLTVLTTHAGAASFEVRLVGATRHLSKREEAGDALAAAATLVPAINQMTFTGAGFTGTVRNASNGGPTMDKPSRLLPTHRSCAW